MRRARPVVIIAGVPVSLLLVELPCATSRLLFHPFFLVANLVLIAILYAIVYLIGQRTKGAVIVFTAVCLAFGAANYFLVQFKGAPLMPADLFAISTATYVASGYTFIPSVGLIIAIALFVVYCVLLHFVPKVRHTGRSFVVSTAVGVIIAVCFGAWMYVYDVEEALGYEINTWELPETYAGYGSALCFAGLFQDLAPTVPEGYEDGAAQEILDEAADYEPDIEPVDSGGEDPTVITVMNETFADLSDFPGMEDSGARPEAFYDIAGDSLESGSAYVSVIGGGTCNSEFEFLTGSSMAFIGGYCYPYTIYNFDQTASLVSYFDSNGYSTHAVHPGAASNWRRDTVYSQLGFDDFADESYFEDADRLRDLVTDRETYDYVLDLLDDDADPQFIFDVTIQNHAGYDTGEIKKKDEVKVRLPDGSTSSDLNEYESCIQRSDDDLAYFVEQLEKEDRPIILCFFGDHQPELSYWLYTETHDGESAYDSGLRALEVVHEVPYFIWANAAARGEDVDEGDDEEVAAPAADGGRDELNDVTPDGGRTESDATASDGGSSRGSTSRSRGTRSAAAPAADGGRDELNDVTSDGGDDESDDAQAADDESDQSASTDEGEGTDGEEESGEDTSMHNVTSLNFLGSRVAAYTGLPLTNYQKLLLETSEDVPAMNLDAYRRPNGVWHSYGESTRADDLLSDYAIVQYYNLFE